MEEHICYIIINIAFFTTNCFTLPIGLDMWDTDDTPTRIWAGVCIVFSLLGMLASALVIFSQAYALFFL
ncbi:MAG: hypothetical protein IJN29_06855 [Akkermansia sp.]|nr:hypothetical protein [Akkermansia sp.]